MASCSKILPEGDRYESSEGDAFALVASGTAYLLIAGALFVGGNVLWAEAVALFGLMNWLWASLHAWLHRS